MSKEDERFAPRRRRFEAPSGAGVERVIAEAGRPIINPFRQVRRRKIEPVVARLIEHNESGLG
ncbi:MAG TPA: hypothetical protein VJK53_04745 [Candidatus Paceibacterota bacterium]